MSACNGNLLTKGSHCDGFKATNLKAKKRQIRHTRLFKTLKNNSWHMFNLHMMYLFGCPSVRLLDRCPGKKGGDPNDFHIPSGHTSFQNRQQHLVSSLERNEGILLVAAGAETSAVYSVSSWLSAR